MPFVPEPGTGLSDATAYIDVAFFDDYHTCRGRSLIDPATGEAYTAAQKEAAIILATDFLDAKFFFIGIRYLQTQKLEWPRTNAYYQDGRQALGVPDEVAECTAELAYKQLTGDEIAPDPQYDANLRPIQRVMEKVGPIETETEYAEGGGTLNFRAFPFAERRLKELIVTGVFVQRI